MAVIDELKQEGDYQLLAVHQDVSLREDWEMQNAFLRIIERKIEKMMINKACELYFSSQLR